MAELKTGTTIGGNTVWHSGNDGTGSGLDADKLDGHDSDYFANAATTQTALDSKQDILDSGSIGNINDPLVYIPFKRANDEVRLSGVQTFTRASTGTYIDPLDGLLKTAAVNEPRFERMADGGIGILMEGKDTNSCLYSKDADNSIWQKGHSSIIANSVTAPDGTLTADMIVDDTSPNTQHSIVQNNIISLNVGDILTLSIFIKANTRTSVRLQFNNSTPWGDYPYADFNVSTANITNIHDSSAIIKHFNNDWYRCILTTPAATNTGSVGFNIYVKDDSGNTTYDGDGTSGLYVWGAQLEKSPFATSYIPTTSGAVTRTADNLYIAANGNIGNMVDDTTYIADYDLHGTFETHEQDIFGVYNSENTYRLLMVDDYGSGLRIYHGSSSMGTSSFGKYTSGVNRVFARVQSKTVTVGINGNIYPNSVQANQEGTGAVKFFIGSRGINYFNIYGHIRNFRIYDKALTDSEIKIA